MAQPFFSVIIPTFNYASFLKDALNSLKKQSFKNFEIIVIDNFSKDNTEEVVNKYQMKIHYEKFNNSEL